MPRQQRDLDPGGGPLVDFARDLRNLRAGAGDPKFATMARKTGRSKTALAEAAGGRRLPRWETVEDFVRACDGDPTPWHERWLAVRAELGGRSSTTEPPDTDGTSDVPSALLADAGTEDRARGRGPDGGAPRSVETVGVVPAPRRRRAVATVLGALGVLVLITAVVGGYSAGRASSSNSTPSLEPLLRAIEIQNMVALDAEDLVEDRTPAYLSVLPLAFCAETSRGCMVEGTEVVTGAALVAHCTTRGQLMYNYDIAEQAALSTPNPHRVSSDLWYRAAFPDGRVGFISEVYLREYSRGGLGLPDCGDAADAGGR